MIMVTLLVAAVSIPFFRYIHPIVPIVYIVAIDTLIWILAQIYKLQDPSDKQITNNKQTASLRGQITKRTLLVLASCILVLFFGVGQTLGILILDSRFERNTHNVGKPPVYVVLSKILKSNTNPNQIIVTNLDTWGSWYGERKTVWFPLEPKQLIEPATEKIPFDAIYLTSYLIDDQNYYMGEGWRLIFENPNDPKKWTCDGCSEITKEFTLKEVYQVNASEDYERQDASAILLIKK
jgi:hypothetical protein